jgi:ribulose kinase
MKCFCLQYGTKLTIDALEKAGHHFRVLVACGGISKNPLYIQTTADVMGMLCF